MKLKVMHWFVSVFPNPPTFGQILGTDYAHSTHTLWPLTLTINKK